MTHNPLYSRLGGSKGRPGRVPKFSARRNVQPSIDEEDAHQMITSWERGNGILPLRGPVCDINRYIMIKEVRQILSVRARKMERFDVCTFDLKRRTTWNLKKSIKLEYEVCQL
jgi:hypothetical protein